MKIRILIFVLIIFTSFSSQICAHDDKRIHPLITENSAKNSQVHNYLKNNLNFKDGLETKLPNNGENTILKWLTDGSFAEDDLHVCRASNHFHDPMNDKSWSTSGMSDEPLWADAVCLFWKPFYSDITWATGFTDPVSTPMPYNPNSEKSPNMWANARTLYLSALTATDQTTKENNFAQMFKALGQVMHLLQDMSVPAHVRNDFESHLTYSGVKDVDGKYLKNPIKWVNNPFERYIKANPKLVNIKQEELLYPNFANPRLTDFWDTNQYTGTNPSDSTTLGLAEITNTNYLSDNTIPYNNPSTEHNYPFPKVDSQDYSICIDNEMDTADPRKYLCRNDSSNPSGAISLINEESSITNDNISTFKLLLDDNIHDAYARALLPLAIGYSSSLLNYFFRGAIEISLPVNDGAYAVATTNDGFDQITLSAKNVSSDTADNMTDGEIYLILKYQVALSDPFQNKGVLVSDDFYYTVVAEKNSIRTIPRTPVKLTFDLSAEKMPIWATDVYLQVVYKGKLGNEDNAVAVGFKDISEPTPFDFVNYPDTCYYSSWVASGSDAAVAMADTNNDGIADSDIFQHVFNDVYIKVSSLDTPLDKILVSNNNYTYHVESIESGGYNRSFLLGDEKFNIHGQLKWVPIDSRDSFSEISDYMDYYYIYNTVTNQSIWKPTQTCCELTGTPSCGTSYSDPNCCERLYAHGCPVRYYPEMKQSQGVYRWDALRSWMNIGGGSCSVD